MKGQIDKGTIIMLCGLPGSGKTTLAKELEVERRAVRFCPDEWILTLIPGDANVAEQDKLREPVEKLLFQTAQKLAVLGVSSILENGFWGRSERDAYRDAARRVGARVELHYLDTRFEKMWKRVEKRNNNLPHGTYAISKEKLIEWQTIFEAPSQEEFEAYDAYKRYE